MCQQKDCAFNSLPKQSRLYIRMVADLLDVFNEPQVKKAANAFSAWLAGKGGLNRLTNDQVAFLLTVTNTAMKAASDGRALRDLLNGHPEPVPQKDGNLIQFPTPPVTT